MNKPKETINMLSGAILPQMLRFALPLLATYLLDIAFLAADKMVAGQCAGSGALAAVSASSSVVTLLAGFFNALAIGATVVIARMIGAKKHNAAEQAVHTAACMSAILAAIVILLAQFLRDPLLRLLNTPADIFESASTYFRIRIFGLAMDLMYKFCCSALRAVGETRKPLVFSTFAGILNVGLNFLLVAGFGMGVAGLAIATDVSSLTCLVGGLCYQLRTDKACKLTISKLKIHGSSLLQIIRIGLPSGIQTSCFNIANAAVQGAINSLGTAAVAGAAAANTYIACQNSVVQASDHAATTWTSQNFGAKQLDRVWAIWRGAVLFAAIFLIPSAVTYMLFGPSLLGVFINQSEGTYSQIIHFGMIRLLYMGCFALVHAMMNITGGVLRGVQKPWLPTISVIFGSVILRLLWLHFIFPLYPAAETIFICYPVTWVLTTAFMVSALAIVLKRYMRAPLLPTT